VALRGRVELALSDRVEEACDDVAQHGMPRSSITLCNLERYTRTLCWQIRVRELLQHSRRLRPGRSAPPRLPVHEARQGERKTLARLGRRTGRGERPRASALHNAHYRRIGELPEEGGKSRCPVSQKLANLTHPGERLGEGELNRQEVETTLRPPHAAPREVECQYSSIGRIS
jgi:hypothetical protein